MSPGSYRLGPGEATLTVHTGTTGAAAKAGHDLRIEVAGWRATLELADDPAASSLTLTADSGSLTVLVGTGGMQALGDDDKLKIKRTLDADVLKGGAIEFRSSRVETDGDRLTVDGELDLLGTVRPLSFRLALGDDGLLTGEAIVRQTAFGIKPYSAMFGALKVADDVRVAVDGRLYLSG
jgi:polyisoprenoid-binding protein YceI